MFRRALSKTRNWFALFTLLAMLAGVGSIPPAQARTPPSAFPAPRLSSSPPSDKSHAPQDIPARYAYFEDFEHSDGGFTVHGASTSWEWGTPTSGPNEAHSGTRLWATNLDGNYSDNERGTLLSPNIRLYAYGGQSLTLTWWQWLQSQSGADIASVYVSKNGGLAWTQVYGPVSGDVDTRWTFHSVTLDPTYSVKRFRVAFRFRSNRRATFPGYYVDDVGLLIHKTYGVTVNPASGTQPGYPGVLATHTLTATNTGNVEDTFDVAVSGNSWTTSAPASVGPLNPGESVAVEVLVNVPAEAILGEADTATVTLSSQGNPAQTAAATLTTLTFFGDVPPDYWATPSILSLLNADLVSAITLQYGIPTACEIGNYCPENGVTRAEMAVFLLQGEHGSSYQPPAATGAMFTDVPLTYWAAEWIEQLAREGITSGCAPGLYCPEDPVIRAQMAVYLLRTEHGSAYFPPPATGEIFVDVPLNYWAAAWIEQLYVEGNAHVCSTSPSLYCPDDVTTHAQMAEFMVKTFDVPMP